MISGSFRESERKRIFSEVHMRPDALYWSESEKKDGVAARAEKQRVEWSDYDRWLRAFLQRDQGWQRDTIYIADDMFSLEKHWSEFRQFFETYPYDWRIEVHMIKEK